VWDGIAANHSLRWGFCGENSYETSSDNIILLGFRRSLGACPNYWSCSGFFVDVSIFANTHRTSGSKRVPPTGVLGCSFVSLSQHVKTSTDRRNLKNCSGPRLFQAFFFFKHIATADATEIATRSRRERIGCRHSSGDSSSAPEWQTQSQRASACPARAWRG
jgi:hypothetical protein